MIKRLKKNHLKYKTLKSFEIQNTKNICDDINDCDIDKIAEILIEKGKNKPFPNIAAN